MDTDSELKSIREDPKTAIDKYDIQSNTIKLTMNAIYGKTIENVERRHRNVITGKDLLIKKNLSSPLFVEHNVLSGGNNPLYHIKMQNRRICLNKPIFMGKTILDRSKLSLMQFVYDDLFRVYGVDNVTINGTDTDSIHVKISGYSIDECYSKMSEFNKVIDRSKVKFNRGEYVRDETHAGELGSWKDEGGGLLMTECYFHRAKQYFEKFEDGSVNAKSKGVSKFVIKDNSEEIFMNRGDGNNAITQYGTEKINKDHRKHCMMVKSIIKKIWGSEEDKVIRNRNGDYRPHGSKELIENAIKSGVNGSIDWFTDYMKFESN